MEDKQIFNIGDLVQLQVYLRKPKLKGIILRNLGYNDNISDTVYEVCSFTRSGILGFYRWTHGTMKVLSSAS
jgi:hypothetical protein